MPRYRCEKCRFDSTNWREWPDPICIQMPDMPTRPPELDIIGCEIRTSYGTGGIVTAVTGPYPMEPDWYARPWMGGYSIDYDDLLPHRRGCKSIIPPVMICPGIDEIVVVKRVKPMQAALFEEVAS